MYARRTFLSVAGGMLAVALGIASVSCAGGTGHASYVDPAVVVLERVLPPPPLPGSAAERAEIDAMLKVQESRTAAQARRASDDATISIFRFADALGSPPLFTEEKLPRVAAFFRKVNAAEVSVVRPAKDAFARKRPYEIESRVHPLISTPPSLAYPSGHAAWAFAAGYVLADMIPERRGEILERATEFSDNRVVAGVHYPSDVDTGRISGSVLAAFLFASPEFRADEKVAAGELRAALGLPPLN